MRALGRFARLPSRLGLLLALALLVLPGCGDDQVVYTYFVVKLDVDPLTVDLETLRKVEKCALRVEGFDEDQVAVPCSFDFNTSYDLGSADFSTNVQEGDLVFILSLFDLNNQKIAEGRTRRSIVKGETISVRVLAEKITSDVDGGAPMDFDAGADAGVPPGDAAP